MTAPALWLAGRELAARGARVALAGAVVAALAAAVTTLELVARARESAVASHVDAMGPALTIVPPGSGAGALARYELAGVIPERAEREVRKALGTSLRALERRLVLRRDVGGVPRILIGVESLQRPPAGRQAAVVGSELGRTIPPGTSLVLGEHGFEVVDTSPSTGRAEDFAIFIPLRAAQDLGGVAGVNELRLYLAAGVSPRAAAARLAPAVRGAVVVRSDRGDVADRELPESLARHRGVAYVVLAAVAALALLIAAHLDATERRTDLATLVAIGAGRGTMLASLLVRSAVVAGAASALGAVAGATIAAVIGPAPSSVWALVASVSAVGVCVGVGAAAPTALLAATRDPVRDLQGA